MRAVVDLYDSHYENIQAEAYQAIRIETYGEDLGQTSWITADECRRFCGWFGRNGMGHLLDVACGSGGISDFIARETGATVTGIDVNESAIRSARTRASYRAESTSLRFYVADATQALPFTEASIDAIFCNDAINHLRDRPAVFREWFRLLRPRGWILYTDPIIVTGCLSNEEIAIRSSVGFYLFTPPGENERVLENTGFALKRREDVTEAVAAVARRWYNAREKRRMILVEAEGEKGYMGLQKFLWTVFQLADEKRLSRYVFLAQKGADP